MSDIAEPDVVDAPEIEALPLNAWHRTHGARMVAFAGYHMPIQYEGIMAEHLWVREHAGLFDVSHMGQVHLAGEGLDAALEALVPADVRSLKPGAQKYSLLLAENGGVLDDLMMTRWDDGSLYMVVNGAVKWDDIAHLREHLPDAVTLNHMADHALLALQGPKAVDALSRLVPGVEALVFMTGGRFEVTLAPPSPSGEGPGVGQSDRLTSASLPHPNPSPEGEGLLLSLWISRSGYTGEDGFEISVPADHVVALADALTAQPEVKPIGLGARDSLRLEADLPLYGHDLDPETTPIMGALNFAVASKRRREEANFPGAERILREREEGPALRRVGLIVEGRQPVREGASVMDGDAPVGRVTSGGFAPTVGRPIAMAYVPAALAAPGARVALSQRGKTHWGTVAPMPFVPHRYHRGVK